MQYEPFGESMSVRIISEDERKGVFLIEGLYTGYGITIGSALRRALLSSLPGAAATQVKLKGVNHEFTVIPGVIEDMVEIMLNLKRIRFRLATDEPQAMSIRFKGEGDVTAADIEPTPLVEIITPECHIATITDASTDFELELIVELGLGYVPAEVRRTEKLPVGVIALDAIFTPVIGVNTAVESMRVGDRTDYDRLRLEVETDKTITPSQALSRAVKILQEHFEKIGELEVTESKPVLRSAKRPRKATTGSGSTKRESPKKKRTATAKKS